MPHAWTFPGGGGEWLVHVDDLGFPIDWAVRVRSVPNAEAQTKVRRQHRQLVGQVDEYDGETTGAPPSLAEAIAAVDAQRAELAANPAEPELQATIILSLAAASLAELEDQAAAVQALFEPHDYGLARPTGGQLALLRSMLPGTAAAPVCRDYTQFLLPRDLAAGAPFCGPEVGDPTGLLLGMSPRRRRRHPGPVRPHVRPDGRPHRVARRGRRPRLRQELLPEAALLGHHRPRRPGRHRRPHRPRRVRSVRRASRPAAPRSSASAPTPTSASTRCAPSPARTGPPSPSASCRCSPAAHPTPRRARRSPRPSTPSPPDRDARLERRDRRAAPHGRQRAAPDPAARSLARRLDHYRRLGPGRLAFGDGEPLRLDADCIVFWAPNLALPDRDTLLNEHLARQMLPEQVLGHALLYLVAAVGRAGRVLRPRAASAPRCTTRPGPCSSSPHGQRLVLEGIRDGRKHNGAIWLASQHPNDLGAGELVDLLGSRFVFRQAPGAIAAALEFLGAAGSDDARRGRSSAACDTGQCLFRDVRDRDRPHPDPRAGAADLRDAFDTTPGGHAAVTGPTLAATQRARQPPAARPPTRRAGPSAASAWPTPEPALRRHRRTPLADAARGTHRLRADRAPQ